MKTHEAAKRVGLHPAQFILVMATRHEVKVSSLEKCWPEIDDGYVDTLKTLLHGYTKPASEEDGDAIKATAQEQPQRESCPAAEQLRFLFKKYVQQKRDQLDHKALTAGTKFGGASPGECLEEAIRGGYIIKPDFRGHYYRNKGDKYAEMVKFVQDGTVSEGIKKIITELCRKPNCLHQI